MNSWQQTTCIALGGLSLVLAGVLIFVGLSNRNIQNTLQQQQAVINQGQVSQQVGTAIVRDLASLAPNNSQIRDLLQRHGYTVTQNP